MLDKKLESLNLLFHLLFCFIMAALQTSFWYEAFGSMPAPFFWIHSICFFALYKENKESYVLLLLGSLSLASFSVAPPGLIFSLSIFCYLISKQIRKQVFWIGRAYFSFVCYITNLSFFILYYLSSWIFETKAYAKIVWWDLIFQPLFTAATAILIFKVLHKIELISGNELLQDKGGMQ